MSLKTEVVPEPLLHPLPESLKADPAYAELAAVLTPSKYMLVLCAPGNPDHRERAPLADPSVLAVDSVQGATAHVIAYRQDNDLGSGNWGLGCGNLYDREHDVVVGSFSYNGRFWSTRDLCAEANPVTRPEYLQSLPERRISGMDALLRSCRRKRKSAGKPRASRS